MAEHAAPGRALPNPVNPVSEVRTGDRRSSIETEPRTLYEEQMAEAKDAAVDVIQTKEPEEAMEIFTTPSEDAMFPQPAAPQSEDSSALGGIEVEINLLLGNSQEMLNANQRQPQALSKPLLSGATSAPF